MTGAGPPSAFLQGPCAIVTGYSAALLAVVARDCARRGGFDRVPPAARAELMAVICAIEHVADAWRAGSAGGTSDPPAAEPMRRSQRVTTTEAATLLRVSERYVRRKAPLLGGELAGGRWVLDRDAVLAERQRRRRETG